MTLVLHKRLYYGIISQSMNDRLTHTGRPNLVSVRLNDPEYELAVKRTVISEFHDKDVVLPSADADAETARLLGAVFSRLVVNPTPVRPESKDS